MTSLGYLIKRNIKLFFKDKGMFFASLITPVILLILYATFLAKVYKDSFLNALPDTIVIAESIIDGTVGAQLMSSILAVSAVTVCFCSNMVMVNDKAINSIRDFTISPVKPYKLAIGYYIATLISTLIIVYIAMFACMIYLAIVGFYMTFADVLLVMLDIFLVTMFGLALSSVINFFLSSQGQISAVGTIVSSGYGFICGAYMPISNFSKGLQNVISFLPGTYGTSLIRNHCMRGVFEEMTNVGFPQEVIEGIKDSVDCNLYFFDNDVSIGMMYVVLIAVIVVLLSIYILLNVLKSRKVR